MRARAPDVNFFTSTLRSPNPWRRRLPGVRLVAGAELEVRRYLPVDRLGELRKAAGAPVDGEEPTAACRAPSRDLWQIPGVAAVFEGDDVVSTGQDLQVKLVSGRSSPCK